MRADNILQQYPDLVLLHAGTNDVRADAPNETFLDAPTRLGNLIDDILSECPETVLLVALLIQNVHDQPQTDWFNAQLPALVEKRFQNGFKISLVNHSDVGGWLLSDGLHPNDHGYAVMAENWMAAIHKLPAEWIAPPVKATDGASQVGLGPSATRTDGSTSASSAGAAATLAVPSKSSAPDSSGPVPRLTSREIQDLVVALLVLGLVGMATFAVQR